MKKLIVWIMAAVIALAASAAPAEEGRPAPLYATVGEAMEAAGDRAVMGGIPGEYYAVVTQKDGKYYRSVAEWDEKLNELYETLNSLDYEAEDFFEKHEAASRAVDDYLKTMPIAYSEMFTAEPLSDAEMTARCGKTLTQLTEEGFEIGSNGTEPGEGDEPIIVYTLRYGVYDYSCVVDADLDRYTAAQDAGTEGELVVKSMALAGITEWGFDQRFHTDGTVEEEKDPFAEMNGILSELGEALGKLQAGEEVDLAGVADALKEKYPDYAEMIDMYVKLYQTYGLEGLMSMMNSAE